MKKIILLALPIALLLGGCTNSKDTVKKDNNKTEVVKKNNENDKKYNQVVQKAEKDGEEQNKNIASFSHSYIKNGQVDRIGEYPNKASDFNNNKLNKAILVKGVITKWAPAPRYNGQVMTYLSVHVKNQYNFKNNTNLEGQNITFYGTGGYTTKGEQDDNIPYKSFAPKPKLTDAERKETMFIENIDIPLPRVGSQVIMAIRPIDIEEGYKDGKKFDENNEFNKDEKYSLGAGIYSIFTLNTKTNKYESLSLNNDGKLTARKPYNKSVDDGHEAVDQTPKRLQEMLDDINQNYR